MTDTHCPYCALQCAQRLGGEPLAAEPRQFPTNGIGMCQKGWTSADLLRVTDRLTSPMRRTDSGFEPVSWDDALGPDRRLTAVLKRRLRETGATAGDRIVLAAAGSTDARALVGVEAMAGQLSETWGVPVPVGYLGG